MEDQKPLTHFDSTGASRMVDVGSKEVTQRVAVAEAIISMKSETLKRITENDFKKGNVFEVARLAGIMAAKRTSELIPLCHLLPLDSTQVDIQAKGDHQVVVTSTVRVEAKTGVEMEALTAVSVAALTIYDMCKAVDRGMEIGSIRLLEKTGGKSGHYERNEAGT